MDGLSSSSLNDGVQQGLTCGKAGWTIMDGWKGISDWVDLPALVERGGRNQSEEKPTQKL